MILNEQEINQKLQRLEQQVGEVKFRTILKMLDTEYRLVIDEFVNANKYYLTLHTLACLQAITNDNFLNIGNFTSIIKSLVDPEWNFDSISVRIFFLFFFV